MFLEDQNSITKIENLYDKYSEDVYQFIFLMIKDSETALDLMHDTFIRSYSSLNKFKGGNEKSWLIKIARNLTIDYLRKRKPVLFYNNKNPDSINYSSPEVVAVLNESEKELYNALNNLKTSYKEVIILRKIKGFTIKETMEILDWNEQKVKNTLNRAMRKLKSELLKEGYDHEQI